MESVSIQIPAELFAALYNHYRENTARTINECLNQLLAEAESTSPSDGTAIQHFLRPGKGTVTGRVWEIADRILRTTGQMDRNAVVQACIAEDINMNTANTQYSHWKKAVTESGSK